MFLARIFSTSRHATAAVRLALYILALGSVAVMLAASLYKPFDLDRYFVAKELVLHVCAASAALLCLVRCRRLALSTVDLMLVGFLLTGLVSSVWRSTAGLRNAHGQSRSVARCCSGRPRCCVAPA